MGVRTKIWGPLAWAIFHAICDALHRGDPRGYKFFELLPYVLPCIYCRRSFADFYPRMKHLAKERGWRFLCYRLHGRVTLKLQTQAWERGDDMTAWQTYTPPFESLPKYDLGAIAGELAYFLYYVHLDWDKERAPKILAWMDNLADILATETTWGEQWYRAWYASRDEYKEARGATDHFRVLQRLHGTTGVRVSQFKYTLHKCRKGVVGC